MVAWAFIESEGWSAMSYYQIFVTSGYAWALSPARTVGIDATAFLVASPTAQDSMFLDNSGVWNVTVNGEVFAEGGHAGIVLAGGNPGVSTITIGTEGEVAGNMTSGWGLYADSAENIKNAGTISGNNAILENASANYTITNATTGVISGGLQSILLQGGGVHTISNAGIISGSDHAVFAVGPNGIENVTNTGQLIGTVDLGNGNDTITNSGKINGDVLLGAGDDVFTNFRVEGTSVVNGTITGTIDLGDGKDKFTGGTNAETVKDGNGADAINLGGGNDRYIATGNTGTDGNDIINGGAGIDTYDASTAAGSVDINLDTVGHGSLAASTAFQTAGQPNGIGLAGITHDTLTGFENVKLATLGGSVWGTSAANVLDASATAASSILHGLGGDDTLIGGAGNDVIEGGAGKDTLTGGVWGSDTFMFQAVADSGATRATRDVITDFSGYGHQGDQINLSAIDANTLRAGNQDFQFTSKFVTGDGLGAFTGLAGELRYVPSAAGAILYGDVNGDKIADFSLDVHMQDGQHTFDTALSHDFVFII
jgi:hypothetical protein